MKATALSISEVKFIMERSRYRKKPDATKSTEEHVKQFSNFTDQSALTELRRTLTQDIFASFEIAQLINLCPETPDEAKALIPSLAAKIDDDTLAYWLIEVKTAKRFQTTTI